jgi:hypothetical protein
MVHVINLTPGSGNPSPGCNECMLHAFQHRRWMRIIANSVKPVNFHEQQAFMKPFAKAFWEKSLEWGKSVGGYRRGQMAFKRMVVLDPVSSTVCSQCAMAMLFRPKMRLKFWRNFMNSPVAHARNLVTFAARTGYPEAAMCFPDDTPMSEACVDETLRHPPCSEYIRQWHIRFKAPNKDATGYLLVSDAMKILKAHLKRAPLSGGFCEADFAPNASRLVHVLTDAPALQNYLKSAHPDVVGLYKLNPVDP